MTSQRSFCSVSHLPSNWLGGFVRFNNPCVTESNLKHIHLDLSDRWDHRCIYYKLEALSISASAAAVVAS
jgi:hypothetical protein